MAAVEQRPAVQDRIPRSRSARLADQAATAALYVTHPERRLSLCEPTTAGPDLQTLIATGSRPGFSHASALAALAQAKHRDVEVRQTTTATFYATDRGATQSPSQEGYRAAVCAVRDRRAITSLPPVSPSLTGGAAVGQTLESQRATSQRGGAISAATGAFGNRRRADSAPSRAPYTRARADSSIDPLEKIDSSVEPTRIQQAAYANARLYTASPPVSPELEEQRRKSILQAATVSMAKEMYNVTETRERGSSSNAVSAAQKGHARARSQRSVSKPDQTAILQAVTIQDIAQKRAAEKLARMEDQTLVYREYYGVHQQQQQQPARYSFSMRRRRGSNETESSGVDVERSHEIRTQMSTLRSKLDAVDEQREKARATLLAAARKNVDAALQDMEMRVYADTGRAPAAMQKELEENAMERLMQGKREIDTEYPMADKVDIGKKTYIDMADVEAIARSRLQSTFDEIDELAETQRAKDLEERLDAEQQQRQRETELQREADLKMEEKLYKAQMKQGVKSKEEKGWLWRRKSKLVPSKIEPLTTQETAVPTEHATSAVAKEPGLGAAEAPEPAEPAEPAEVVPEPTEQTQTTEAAGAIVSGGIPEEEAQIEPATKQESKLKSWFKDRLRRRSSNAAADASQAEEKVAAEANEADTANPAEGVDTVGQTGETNRIEETAGETREAEDPEAERSRIAKPIEEEPPQTAEGDSRSAALRSHPVTAGNLGATKSSGPSQNDSEDRLNGMSTTEYDTTQQGSKEKVEQNTDLKRNRLKEGLKKIISRNSGDAKEGEAATSENVTQEAVESTEQTLTNTQDAAVSEHEALNETASEQELAVPSNMAKPMSNGTGRESRFCEDL